MNTGGSTDKTGRGDDDTKKPTSSLSVASPVPKLSVDDERRTNKIFDKLTELQKLTLNRDIGDKMTSLFKRAEIKRILKLSQLSRNETDITKIQDMLGKIKFF